MIVPHFHVQTRKAHRLFQAEQKLWIRAVKKTHAAFELPKTKMTVAIVVMADTDIQVLNRDFRGKDKPTNVLSFPQIEDFSNLESQPAPIELGDIILGYETLVREAHEQGKTLRAHVVHLIIHGMLHLFGYDHMTAREAKEMEALECSLLEDLGFYNPY